MFPTGQVFSKKLYFFCSRPGLVVVVQNFRLFLFRFNSSSRFITYRFIIEQIGLQQQTMSIKQFAMKPARRIMRKVWKVEHRVTHAVFWLHALLLPLLYILSYIIQKFSVSQKLFNTYQKRMELRALMFSLNMFSKRKAYIPYDLEWKLKKNRKK